MKRKTTAIFASVLILLTAACSSTNGDQAGSKDQQTVTLKFFHRWPSEPRNSYFNYIVKEFEKQNPGVKIEMESVLNDSYKEKIKVLVSSNNIPDVFTSWSDSFAENLVSSGKVKDVTSMFDSDATWANTIIKSQIKPFTFNGKIYGVPFTMDGKAFFYNKKAFEKAGIQKPKTWDELIAALDKLKGAGYDAPLMEGLQNTWAVSHYLGTMNQRMLSPEVIAKDYKTETAQYSDPGYVKVLEYWDKLVSYMGPAATSIDHEAARNLFIAEKVPVMYLQFAELGYLTKNPKLDFDFFNFPAFPEGKGNPGALTGAPEGFMISNTGKHQELAEKFVKFIVSPENAAKFQKDAGAMTAVKGSATAENSPKGTLEAVDVIMNASETTPWLDNAMNIAIADAFMKGGQAMASKSMTPQQVMESVQKAAKLLQSAK
ncbi:ABC transporter substrate-binding protein [Paenibacillus elgii]|uniref:ABC transporter substrate-binding protein n=1 Tax=Paenibacillus elgii TaxID=189691 RepID=A0A163VFS9_9BACL|nr:extracellular solute-binding protein [Paenibacillus elgii]KZE74826.1 ABC transporter substrate-binding protein [Paenibacillus elgii]NEN85616.1 extracellular solute-binding protein [Paenibacillus elgii]